MNEYYISDGCSGSGQDKQNKEHLKKLHQKIFSNLVFMHSLGELMYSFVKVSLPPEEDSHLNLHTYETSFIRALWRERGALPSTALMYTHICSAAVTVSVCSSVRAFLCSHLLSLHFRCLLVRLQLSHELLQDLLC